MEYRLRYRHTKGEAEISLWEETMIAPIAATAEEAEEVEAETEAVEVVKEGDWRDIGLIDVSIPLDEQAVTMWVPFNLLGDETGADQFCWLAEAKNKTKGFSSNPPTERLPSSEDPRLTQYEILGISKSANRQTGESASQPRQDILQVSEAATQPRQDLRQVSEAAGQRIGGLVH